MFLKTILAFTVSILGVVAHPTSQLAPRQSLKFAFGQQKVQGVNLGGWFVLEPWITPGIFDALNGAAIDEFTLCQTLGKDEAYSRLSNHWNSWITESDFYNIANAGLNFVRIPIGYWSVIPIDGEPYVQGAYDVLAKALDWANNAGLKVMIDLHGAAGSQNGFDNSGKAGYIGWGQGSTVSHTVAVLNKIRDDHANHPAVATIELVNEPLPPNAPLSTVQDFYGQAWSNLVSAPIAVTMHDAFQSPPSWNGYGSNMYNVVLDTHHYEVFSQDVLSLSPQGHVAKACDFGNQMRAVTGKWTISGEWTGAATDCARYLNGYGKGARYEGAFGGVPYIGSCAGLSSGSVSQLSQQQRNDMRAYIEAQLDAFESASGWIWWTWKTEQGAPGWDLGDLLQNGVFPQPLGSRYYPGQCNV